MDTKARQQAGRALRTPTTWEDIPTGARVFAGDVLVFDWRPAGWTGTCSVHGLVLASGVENRSWFVAVDSHSGRQGTWYVRWRRRQFIGVPHDPADDDWWLTNPPSDLDLVQIQVRDGRGVDPDGQLLLFEDGGVHPNG